MIKKWHKLITREGVDLTTISLIDEAFYDLFWDYTKTKDELMFTTFNNRTLTHYICVDDSKVARHNYKKYFKNPDAIKKYYSDGLEILKKNKNDAKFWQKSLGKLDSQKLLDALDVFCNNYQPVNYLYSIKSFFIIESWQADLDEIVSRLIKKNKLENQKTQIINSIYRPWKKTALIKLQDKLNRGVNLNKLIKDYQFLRSWTIIRNRPNESWITNLGGNNNSLEVEKYYSTKQLVSLLKPNEEEKYFIELAPYIIFFKDWRDDLRREFVYIWSFLFDEISEFLKLDRNDLGYLTIEEIKKSLLNNKVDNNLIDLRKNNPCLVTINGERLEMKVIDSPIPQRYQEIINNISKTDVNNQEIKGTIAQTGIARGQVRIINSFHDIKKFKAGEILVANTTHPNYLPAMKIASAFVTNEGGVICHAAIVARELKKPCIVGTKIATKLLQDGDSIEVNANVGVITKLKDVPTR
ncbi:MAG: phosphoenolpyruvate synthase [uncultured bacterium]|nr:MAG: phosphoenolpyruvate synthase [uncultured bacterium]